jgi:uncharacterized protein (TIGR02271 family)
MTKKPKSYDDNPENRDPITKEPGAHPIGTGVGAAAAGAAGAAVGSVAGPVGTAVGATAGAVVGGLGGKAVAESFNPTTGDLERYLDYTVVDRDGNKVGSVDAVWQDHSGQPAYVAVKTGWLGLGKAHVVPAMGAEVSDSTRKIRLPYTEDMIKNAPSFHHQDEIDEVAEVSISDYYRQHGYAGMSGTCGCEVGDAGTEGADRVARGDEKDEARITLSEEEVKIGKREVEAGGIRLRKIIRTETVNQPVELQREEIVIERVPAKDRPTSRTDVAFREEEIYIPLRREEPVVEKTARTREEVRVGKKRETETREVTETVRREDVDIQRQDTTRGRDTKKRT